MPVNFGFGRIPRIQFYHCNAFLFLPISLTVTLPKNTKLPDAVAFGDGFDISDSSGDFHSNALTQKNLDLPRRIIQHVLA